MSFLKYLYSLLFDLAMMLLLFIAFLGIFLLVYLSYSALMYVF